MAGATAPIKVEMKLPSTRLNMTSPSAWYIASTIAQANNSDVTTWADSSGNGYTLTSGATKAKYMLNVVNGEPAVLFAGLTQLTSTATLANLLGATGLGTVYAAIKPVTVGGVTNHLIWSGSGATPTRLVVIEDPPNT